MGHWRHVIKEFFWNFIIIRHLLVVAIGTSGLSRRSGRKPFKSYTLLSSRLMGHMIGRATGNIPPLRRGLLSSSLLKFSDCSGHTGLSIGNALLALRRFREFGYNPVAASLRVWLG
jgi:hypothetical protein